MGFGQSLVLKAGLGDNQPEGLVVPNCPAIDISCDHEFFLNQAGILAQNVLESNDEQIVKLKLKVESYNQQLVIFAEQFRNVKSSGNSDEYKSALRSLKRKEKLLLVEKRSADAILLAAMLAENEKLLAENEKLLAENEKLLADLGKLQEKASSLSCTFAAGLSCTFAELIDSPLPEFVITLKDPTYSRVCHMRIPDEVIGWPQFDKLVEVSRANIPPAVLMTRKQPMLVQEGKGADESALTEVFMNTAGFALNQLFCSSVLTLSIGRTGYGINEKMRRPDFLCTRECSKEAVEGLWLRESVRRIIVAGETKRLDLIRNGEIDIVKSFTAGKKNVASVIEQVVGFMCHYKCKFGFLTVYEATYAFKLQCLRIATLFMECLWQSIYAEYDVCCHKHGLLRLGRGTKSLDSARPAFHGRKTYTNYS
jgi:hypothetical protein